MPKPIELKDGELILWCELAPFGVFPGERDGNGRSHHRDKEDRAVDARAAQTLVH